MEPMDDSSDNSNQTWLQEAVNAMQLNRTEMNALIMDYLVHEGFKEAAERFREEAGIELRSFVPNTDHLSKLEADMDDETRKAEARQSERNRQERKVARLKNGSIVAGNNSRVFVVDEGNNSGQTNAAGTSNGQADHVKMEDANDKDRDSDEQMDEASGSSRDQAPAIMETFEMMDRRIEIRHLIEEGDILRGQSLINLYYPEMLDNHRDIYFKLQQQHLIELIRQQKINDVLAYVHDHLSLDELKDLSEMERTLALLAYEQPDKSPYANLLQLPHRYQLASEINDIILEEAIGSVTPVKPRLVTLLKLLFWTQSELERKKIQFPKMTDLVNGTIVEQRQ